MSDDESEDESENEPAVEIGEGESVAGAPLTRVGSRLTWGIEQSKIIEREGDTEIRTPDGPQTLATLLEDVDVPYFEHRREFESAVREVVGDGPIPTE
jgi:hypothetical protein